MNIKISRGALRGTVQMISSKSDAHRLFIGAALADQPTEMMINGSSEDSVFAGIGRRFSPSGG